MKEKVFDVTGFQNHISSKIKEYMAFMLDELANNKEFVKKVQEDKELSNPDLPKEQQEKKVKEFLEEFKLTNSSVHWDKVVELFTLNEEKLKTFIL